MSTNNNNPLSAVNTSLFNGKVRPGSRQSKWVPQGYQEGNEGEKVNLTKGHWELIPNQPPGHRSMMWVPNKSGGTRRNNNNNPLSAVNTSLFNGKVRPGSRQSKWVPQGYQEGNEGEKVNLTKGHWELIPNQPPGHRSMMWVPNKGGRRRY